MVDNTHFIKEIKLKEKPLKKHCVIQYTKIIITIVSKMLKLFLIAKKNSSIILTPYLFVKRFKN